MARNEGQEVKITDEQRVMVLQEVVEEMRRREYEMQKDTYGSRDYCDGVRSEVTRVQEWLTIQIG